MIRFTVVKVDSVHVLLPAEPPEEPIVSEEAVCVGASIIFEAETAPSGYADQVSIKWKLMHGDALLDEGAGKTYSYTPGADLAGETITAYARCCDGGPEASHSVDVVFVKITGMDNYIPLDGQDGSLHATAKPTGGTPQWSEETGKLQFLSPSSLVTKAHAAGLGDVTAALKYSYKGVIYKATWDVGLWKYHILPLGGGTEATAVILVEAAPAAPAKPYVVCVGKTITIPAEPEKDSSKPVVDYKWLIEGNLGTFNPKNGNLADVITTQFTGTKAGTGKARLRPSDADATGKKGAVAEVDVIVVKVDLSEIEDIPLNAGDAAKTKSMTVTITPSIPENVSLSVAPGSGGSVTFNPTTVTGTGGVVEVTGTSKSSALDDVTIEAKISSTVVASQELTVYEFVLNVSNFTPSYTHTAGSGQYAINFNWSPAGDCNLLARVYPILPLPSSADAGLVNNATATVTTDPGGADVTEVQSNETKLEVSYRTMYATVPLAGTAEAGAHLEVEFHGPGETLRVLSVSSNGPALGRPEGEVPSSESDPPGGIGLVTKSANHTFTVDTSYDFEVFADTDAEVDWGGTAWANTLVLSVTLTIEEFLIVAE